jgi:cell division protein FtsB
MMETTMADDKESKPSNTSRLLPRPRVVGEPLRPSRTSVASTNAIDRHVPGDHTKLILRHRNRVLLGVAASIIGAALIVTLVLTPIRTWFSQTTEVKKGQSELDALNAANAVYEAQNERLRTAEGIKEAARKTLGLVGQKERRSPLLPFPELSASLPAGLPYSLVAGILNVRISDAAMSTTTAPATTAPATTAPATTTTATTTTAMIAPVTTQPLDTAAVSAPPEAAPTSTG